MKLRFVAAIAVLGTLLAGCGSTASSPSVPSIGIPANPTTTQMTPTQVENLLLALLPTALQNQGVTKQTFCLAFQVEPQQAEQAFVGGFNGSTSTLQITTDEAAAVFTQFCATSV